MSTLLDIGDSLVRARRASGISQRELADALGTSQQQIARWEAGAYRSATLERVAKVARAIEGVTPSALLASETVATYRTLPSPSARPDAALPVRDLGEIAARIRASGAELSGTYHLDRIGVFGSFAAGEQGPTSDVDLLVETADPGGFRFVSAANFTSGILGRKVDFVRPHLLRDRLRARVLSEVVYVWSA